MKNPLVSVIALNYNQTAVTCEFLKSLKGVTYKNLEVIVVDNASKEDPTDMIMSTYLEVRLIRSDKNLGFTGGNNLGIEASQGAYIFIVNNDTEVTPGIFEKLLAPFQQDQKIGMVSPKIYFYQQPNTIQYAGFSAVNPFTGRNRGIGNKEEDHGQHDRSGFTHYAHGAAMMVSREVIEQVGMFPDIFFIYYEELDWSSQVTKAGYKIYYQAEASLYHKESMTMGKESAIKAYYHNRNRILFMRRHSTPLQMMVFTLFLCLFTIPKTLLKYLLKGQFEHLRAFRKALAWHLHYTNDPKDMATRLNKSLRLV